MLWHPASSAATLQEDDLSKMAAAFLAHSKPMRRLLCIMSMVLPTGYGKRLIFYQLAPLVAKLRGLLIGHSVIQLRALIFSNGAAPRVGPFSLLIARLYSFVDAGLGFLLLNH